MRVGLTGSIAVGKSFVSGVLAELGCRVVDADVVARRVVEPGAEGLRRIVEAFGEWVLRPDGALDRAAVSAVIFRDEAKRGLINSLLHPLIMAEQDELLRRWELEDPGGVGVVDAALLIESGGHGRFDKLVVVHCRPEVQLERLMRRNNLSREEAAARAGSKTFGRPPSLQRNSCAAGTTTFPKKRSPFCSLKHPPSSSVADTTSVSHSLTPRA